MSLPPWTVPATLALAIGACAQTAPVRNEIHATFACATGRSIDATFVNGAASSMRLMLSDGRTLSLPRARSGSGARYANGDESIVFWNKGNTAFIEEGGQTTYADCVTSR